jgi:hypothetical protein
MLRMVNMAKVKQLKLKRREVAFTTLWLVLFGAAMAFIAIAGHI